MYYNARYYDPQIGHFISPDTIVPNPTNVLDYNRYMYVRGNPISFSDPSGHEPCESGNENCLAMQLGLALSKAMAKEYWACLAGCLLSSTDWTFSIDLGGMLAPVGPAGRGQVSLAIDSDGGLALIGAAGGGGSTPVVSGGVTFSATNAPSVDDLSGISVQVGGSAGTVFYAEGIVFTDSEGEETYFGASVAPATRLSVTYFPPQLKAQYMVQR